MDIEAIVKKYIRRNGWSFSHDGECADAIRAALTELAVEYEEQLEVERMRLAACGVIAMSNTAESASKARQMREAFEKWAKMRVPYRALKELDDEGEYDDQEVRMMWCAWQAAQSVPVVGEPVAYGVPNSRPTESLPFMQVMLQIPANAQYPELLVPLIVKPTHSIPAAELEALRKDAENWRNRHEVSK